MARFRLSPPGKAGAAKLAAPAFFCAANVGGST